MATPNRRQSFFTPIGELGSLTKKLDEIRAPKTVPVKSPPKNPPPKAAPHKEPPRKEVPVPHVQEPPSPVAPSSPPTTATTCKSSVRSEPTKRSSRRTADDHKVRKDPVVERKRKTIPTTTIHDDAGSSSQNASTWRTPSSSNGQSPSHQPLKKYSWEGRELSRLKESYLQQVQKQIIRKTPARTSPNLTLLPSHPRCPCRHFPRDYDDDVLDFVTTPTPKSRPKPTQAIVPCLYLTRATTPLMDYWRRKFSTNTEPVACCNEHIADELLDLIETTIPMAQSIKWDLHD